MIRAVVVMAAAIKIFVILLARHVHIGGRPLSAHLCEAKEDIERSLFFERRLTAANAKKSLEAVLLEATRGVLIGLPREAHRQI